ncbi:RNA polymerase sigma factor [Limobrevibacterium gyesilva]|uniref:Sigma-70 family RNA polymerase sigma factor n=1 Tax=Limobrevibacterium gyesilva TaxID=2991712 RepID=A0AA41YSD0_9PROT|nr:sigma-70 family RNA polymerase sigma factor [Limobrevibacterium gyesilva]MCW3475630.1 sigma-70 family RNA polymerase sigma factor [Limobrevibacterium gyesilva]
MSHAEFDKPEFLALLRSGDEHAYRRLIRRFHGSLVGVASAIIGSRAQAEEVVQDAWLAVFSGIARFEGRSSLASWVFTIVLNRARTRATRERRLVSLPTVLEGFHGEERAVDHTHFVVDGHWREAPRLWDELDPERVVGGRELWRHVRDVIEHLPAGQRAVIILRDIEGHSAEEACALLQISAENQRVLLHRARGRVRKAIDEVSGSAAPAATPVPRAPRHQRPAGQALGRLAAVLAAAGAAYLPPMKLRIASA